MKYLYKKIYEAINTGIQRALSLDDEDVSIIYQHKKISNDADYFNYLYAYDQYQEKYKELINKRNFQKCLELYNSEYLEQKPKTIKYKIKSKKELQKIVKKFNYKRCDGFDLNWLDVSEITDMSELFCDMTRFNCNISEWNVSNVTDMNYMFYNCEYFNSDLSQWNVSKVENMQSMFYECKKFTSDLSQWNVSKVKSMSHMFYGCKKFTSDLSQWNVSNVTDMKGMFCFCEKFNSDLSQWNVSKVENMHSMFIWCDNFDSDLSKWKVSNVKDYCDIFAFCPIKEEYKPKFNI
ncbi:MAG: hypothetical protein [Wendovervirus sonii]|uniref:BspA family leucine-rich repeat surface protein n=1 Tax=phage Lak_Megaphage_Sonny TaxID=3109229 RepID=A0ABZ0Z5C6_9CAUD|nr:MAG: hypothetical protein [phage Lak_Megaphage_Sonny]